MLGIDALHGRARFKLRLNEDFSTMKLEKHEGLSPWLEGLSFPEWLLLPRVLRQACPLLKKGLAYAAKGPFEAASAHKN